MLTAVKAFGALLLPPGILILLALAGLLLLPRRRRAGAALLWTAVLALLLLSLPLTGRALLAGLERQVPALAPGDPGLARRAQAIVVLGGGRTWNAPELAGDTVNRYTLERLRYAAHLQRTTGLPLLVSGGTVFGEATPEAELMRRALARDFGVPVQWTETRARNTFENALYARAILAPAGIRSALVVTHAWHMPRVRWSFAQVGLEPVPAPLGFSTGGGSWLALVPTAEGLGMSRRALRERLGLLWYRLRYGREASVPVPASAPAAG